MDRSRSPHGAPVQTDAVTGRQLPTVQTTGGQATPLWSGLNTVVAVAATLEAQLAEQLAQQSALCAKLAQQTGAANKAFEEAEEVRKKAFLNTERQRLEDDKAKAEAQKSALAQQYRTQVGISRAEAALQAQQQQLAEQAQWRAARWGQRQAPQEQNQAFAPVQSAAHNLLLPGAVGSMPPPDVAEVHMATTPTTWTDASAQRAQSIMSQPLRLNVQQPGTKESVHVPVQRHREQEVHDKAQKNAERLRALWEEKRSAESKEGYFEPFLGQLIDGESSKYIIYDATPLGVGTFSSVFLAANNEQKLVALKVIRSQPHFKNYASKEVALLVRIRECSSKDQEGSSNCLMLRDHFMHEDHLCMVFDKLGTSLRIFGRQALDKVISFSKQLLLALRYLHDGAGLIHCDVKPDNLLVRHDGQAIKLCDFGTAGFSKEKQSIDELQPLFYRAPEVIVGAPRGRKIDIWSSGCTIFELAVGRILFRDCNSVRDCLEKTMRLRGAIPEHMRKQGRNTAAFFNGLGFIPEAGGPQNLQNFKAKPMYQELAGFVDFGTAKGLSAQDLATSQLGRLIGGTTVVGAAGKQAARNVGEGEKKLEFLADLIESCMNVDPSLRISAADACKVSVFRDVRPPPESILEDAPPLPEDAAPPLPPVEPARPHRPASVPTVELVSAECME